MLDFCVRAQVSTGDTRKYDKVQDERQVERGQVVELELEWNGFEWNSQCFVSRISFRSGVTKLCESVENDERQIISNASS